MRKITFVLVVFFLFTSNFPVFAATVVTPVSVDTTSPVIGDSFSVTASVSGALTGNTYFLKCRIGANSSSLIDGQTYNPQIPKWLDDVGPNSVWIDMPQVTIGGDGTWQGALQCRIKNGATDEAKLLFMRACLNTNSSCGTIFQSSSSLTLNPLVPSPTSTPTPTLTPIPIPTSIPTAIPTSVSTSTPVPTVKPQSTPTKYVSPTAKITPASTSAEDKSEGSVLGEITQASITPEEEKIAGASSKSALPVFLGLLGSGLLFIVAAVVISIKQIKKTQ